MNKLRKGVSLRFECVQINNSKDYLDSIQKKIKTNSFHHKLNFSFPKYPRHALRH